MYKDRLLWLKKTKLFFSTDYYDFLDYDNFRKFKVYLSEKGLPSTRNRALLGMGKDSPLWHNLIQSMLDEDLQKLFIVFNYKTTLDTFDSITFDPEQNEESVYTSLKITSELNREEELQFLSPLPSNGLIFDGQMVAPDMELNVKGVQVCLDNTELSFIIFKEKLNFMNYLKNFICKNPKICERKEDLIGKKTVIHLKITMPAIDNDKKAILEISTKELYSIQSDGEIVWNFKEFNDFLDNQTNSPEEANSENEYEQAESQDLRMEPVLNSKESEDYIKKNDGIWISDTEYTQNIERSTEIDNEKESPKLKYDYYESLDGLYKELQNKEQDTKQGDTGEKFNCDILLGARFMFKYNIVFKIVKKNDYPLDFELGLAFKENKKYIQNWQMGFLYLGASLVVALVIIFMLRNTKEVKKVAGTKDVTAKLKTE
jgi:hypothetical protein